MVTATIFFDSVISRGFSTQKMVAVTIFDAAAQKEMPAGASLWDGLGGES